MRRISAPSAWVAPLIAAPTATRKVTSDRHLDRTLEAAGHSRGVERQRTVST